MVRSGLHGTVLGDSLGGSLGTEVPSPPALASPLPSPSPPLPSLLIDGKPWRRIGFGSQLICEDCGIEYPAPEPRLYSFNSPLGACPECEGFGNVIGLDMELIVPDPEQIAPRGGHRAVEHAGLRARTERTARLGPRLRHSDRRALPPAFRAAGGAYRPRRAGAKVRRAGRLFRLARTAEVQNAHPRVS